MAEQPVSVSESTSIAMPIRNLISIVLAVAVGVWAYFGVIERLNRLEVNEKLTTKDLSALEKELKADIEKNNDFRIKWPRGEMGTLPADSEQFMLLEHMASQIEELEKEMQGMRNNTVNLNRAMEDIKNIESNIESMKDKIRNNGSHQ